MDANTTTAQTRCPECGYVLPAHWSGCVHLGATQILERVHIGPPILTEADVRRIVLEELARLRDMSGGDNP